MRRIHYPILKQPLSSWFLADCGLYRRLGNINIWPSMEAASPPRREAFLFTSLAFIPEYLQFCGVALLCGSGWSTLFLHSLKQFPSGLLYLNRTRSSRQLA